MRAPAAGFGAYDHRALTDGPDCAVFETEPFVEPTELSGPIVAEIWAACDCRDFDLWVRLFDVAPDGAVWNLMSPGLDVQRASAREQDGAAGRSPGRVPVEPGKPILLRLDRLVTANLFAPGHRLRAVVSGSYAPHLSRNLQTGESERSGSVARAATLTVLHDMEHFSRLIVPLVQGEVPSSGPLRLTPVARRWRAPGFAAP